MDTTLTDARIRAMTGGGRLLPAPELERGGRALPGRAPPRRGGQPDPADLPGERAAVHAGPARVAGGDGAGPLPRLRPRGHARRAPARAAPAPVRVRGPRRRTRRHHAA